MQVSIPTSDLGGVSTSAPLNVRAFCTCDAFPGDFHEIVPGVCPDTYTESTDGRRVTLVAGDQPGTLRVGDPRQASGPGPDGTVTLVPIVTHQENGSDIDDAMGAALVLVEWPERLGPALPARRLDIALIAPRAGGRDAAITLRGTGWDAVAGLLEAWR